jgi:hypothetical protein
MISIKVMPNITPNQNSRLRVKLVVPVWLRVIISLTIARRVKASITGTMLSKMVETTIAMSKGLHKDQVKAKPHRVERMRIRKFVLESWGLLCITGLAC